MFRPEDFPGYGVDIILIFDAVCHEFQFKHRRTVVVVKLLIFKHSIGCADIGLGQRDFFCLFQGNIGRFSSIFDISWVVIVVVNGHNARGKAQSLHRILGAGAHIGQKVAAWKHRTRFQLQDNVLLVAVNILYKIAGLIDFNNQILKNFTAIFSDIVLIGGHNAFAILILSGQGGNPAFFVVLNLDFRVDA